VDASAYIAPRYWPQDPACKPYWDAFYENPYPSSDGYKLLSDQLKMYLLLFINGSIYLIPSSGDLKQSNSGSKWRDSSPTPLIKGRTIAWKNMRREKAPATKVFA
jgi:hypothetical protein